MIVCCGILKEELKCLMEGREDDVFYLDPGQHVEPDRLAQIVRETLKSLAGKNVLLVIGTQCAPDLEKLAGEYGARIVPAKNCIEMLLGDDLARLDSEAKSFYLTTGWLENWRKIFVEGLKWDEVDARQNFGYYDRILLLDTGLSPIDDEKILEFYDYTQVPIEIMPVKLDNLRKLLDEAMNG
ncbi:MAG: DUF1638 domain-containing protein [Firmicutes bacterium]|nr:DUF1638 domain-containing protein [Bacillota bacterium]